VRTGISPGFVTNTADARQTVNFMKSTFFALLLVLGSPFPSVEAAPSNEEEAVVEMTRTERRASSLERLKSHVLPPAPAASPRPSIPVLLRPTPHVEPASAFTRPPPAR